MLEDHIVLFIQQWQVGLGMRSEQGAKSIPASFNPLQRTYSSINTPLRDCSALSPSNGNTSMSPKHHL